MGYSKVSFPSNGLLVNVVQARNTPAKACPRENGEQGSREGRGVAPLPLASRINYGAGYERDEGGAPAGVGIANAR